MSDAAKKALKALGVTVKFSGAFVAETNETKRLLAIAEPFVTWGPPNLRSIRELIFKRGLARKEKEKAAPLMDNTVIESVLGHAGIICMEDLVHEIFTVGPHFDQVNQFVGKFSLSKPFILPPDKMTHFTIGGRFGDRGDKINDLIQSMV
jgi:large subunit ribosomal protein L7e